MKRLVLYSFGCFYIFSKFFLHEAMFYSGDQDFAGGVFFLLITFYIGPKQRVCSIAYSKVYDWGCGGLQCSFFG